MNPPRRPPGQPPARSPPSNPSNGVDLKRPPGPPPGAPPLSDMKPPPRAPPPKQLNQTIERPPIDAPNKSKEVTVTDEAHPKSNSYVPTPTKKSGAIAMFESPIEKNTPSESKIVSHPPMNTPPPNSPPPRGPPINTTPQSMIRSPRPLPPKGNPPGIPDGQPMPPIQKSEDMKKTPAPVRPPPSKEGGGRVAPTEGQQSYAERKELNITPPPPTNEPPLLRVKKKKVNEVPLKRREKDLPEFESSDEDEEGPPLISQPLPFGVLKQPLPMTHAERKLAEEKEIREALLAKQQEESTALALRQRELAQKAREDAAPPSVIPKENKLTGFVPAAPTEGVANQLGKHFDDSKLAQHLTRGRITIKCIEGIEIRRKDDLDKIPRNDPFIKFRLGVAERHPWKNSTVKRKQDSNPKFDDELIYFDITDPAQYVFNEDLQLCIELWNKSMTKNDLVGTVTMSMVRFMKQPFVAYTEKVPIYYPGATRTTMKLLLEIVFEEARSGLMQITLFEASGLRNIDPMGQQDPYVQFSLGPHYKKKSKTIKNGGVNPYFQEDEVLLWLDQDNWVNNLKVEVLDEDAKEEKPIGFTDFSLLPYMKTHPNDAKEDTYDLFYHVLVDPKDESEIKEVPCGEIILRIRFLPAGKLTVFIDRAKDLEFPESHKPVAGEIVRMDPYTNLTVEGKAVKMIKRTPADKDGGSDPIWQSEIKFEIVDQYLIELEVFNQSIVGKDTLLGSTQISLLNVFRSGITENWISLRQRKANGGIKEIGDIFVKLVFTGPLAIAYPQLRPEMDSFDDAIRNEPKRINSDDENNDYIPKPEISTLPDNELSKEEQLRRAMDIQAKQEQHELPPEFNDEEIIAAFKFIDLDHNNFVGAAEIRHILICMGEMITDEEIDMMISMVDMDGDGQISYKEFRTLVLHPNPGVADMHKEINKEKDNELMKEKQALAGKTTGLDLTAFQRQKEISVREQKKKMIVQFVIDNEVDFNYIKKCYGRLLEVALEKRINGRIQFKEFCFVCDIEPIQEYKNLHAFYDTEQLGDMDIREFLLSMMNFIEVDKELRIKFSFEMFDELLTGYISQIEVERILSGNHMLSIYSVRRKAETIMKQANSTKTGSITMKEFVVVSKKFPNILLPAVGFIPEIKIATVGDD